MPIDKIDPVSSVDSSNPIFFKTIPPQKNDTTNSSSKTLNNTEFETAAFIALAAFQKKWIEKEQDSLPHRYSKSIPLKDLPIDLIKKLMKSFIEEANHPLKLESERAEKRERFLDQLYAEFSSAFQENLERIREQ